MINRLMIIGAFIALVWNLASHPEELAQPPAVLIAYCLGSMVVGAGLGGVIGVLLRLISPSTR